MDNSPLDNRAVAKLKVDMSTGVEKLELIPLPSKDKSDEAPVVAVLGNGNYGKALAIRFNDAGVPVFVGSRNPSRRKFLPDRANLVTYMDAAESADLVFVCVPVNSYDDVIPPLRDSLIGKIVVDISNPTKETDPCGAHLLTSLLPHSRVLKALNTISAWALESDTFGGSRETYICGDDKGAKHVLSQFLREVGFQPIDSGGIKVASRVERLTLKLFPEWRFAIILTLVLAAIFTLYYYVYLFVAAKAGVEGAKRMGLYHANRIICWVALWLFSLVYLPGCLAGYLQIFNGTKYKPFPKWIDRWMKSRKQIGLIALMCASMHACLSLAILGAEQVTHMSDYVQIPGTEVQVFRRLKWNGEPSLLFATLAITSFGILGITSLPTVNARMSWREWDFIHTKLGYVGLFFATTHVFIYVFRVYDPVQLFKERIIPPAAFFQPLLPIIVMLMRLSLMLPGINSYLWRIRGGWERVSFEEKRSVQV